MNLAWKEIKFYKFRFILIMFIIFLMAIMVLFISGLAQGLARENISIFDQIKGNQFVVQKMKEPQLEKSILSRSKQDNISKIIDEKPFKMAGKTFKINGNEENVMAINSVKNHQPNLKSGHYPKNGNQIAINEKLTAEGLYLDDKVKVKGDDTTYKVVGILKNTMYSHSNIVMMDQSKIEQSSNVATFYVTNQLSKSDKNKINHIKGVQTATTDNITSNIASYKAEQTPLDMMIISLYIITAIVLSAFFYVMTIQKTSEIGILKAIGITTKHLLTSLILQISMITFIGVAIAEVVIFLISQILPVSMPFHIDMHNIIIVLVVFMIVGKDISKTFGEKSSKTEVLKDINFEVKDGEFIILNGASGSGKTTLLTILGGLLSQTSGDVVYEGKSLFERHTNKAHLRLNDIGFIFQASHLVPYLKVLDQLTLIGKEAGMSSKEAQARAKELLKKIGLEEQLNSYPHMLSGGQQQRVAIMRALMNHPKIVLADEPTASLDASRAQEVVEMIRKQIKANQMIGIMITHDESLFKYADRIVQLYDGKIKNS